MPDKTEYHYVLKCTKDPYEGHYITDIELDMNFTVTVGGYNSTLKGAKKFTKEQIDNLVYILPNVKPVKMSISYQEVNNEDICSDTKN